MTKMIMICLYSNNGAGCYGTIIASSLKKIYKY